MMEYARINFIASESRPLACTSGVMLVMGKYHIVTFGGPASRHTLIRFSNITKRRNASVCNIYFTKGHTLMVEKFAGCMRFLKLQFANYCWT
jgi:hypothetical protein